MALVGLLVVESMRFEPQQARPPLTVPWYTPMPIMFGVTVDALCARIDSRSRSTNAITEHRA